MNCSSLIKILTLQSSIKINGEKKLLFQASTFKNNLFISVFQYVLNEFKRNIREIHENRYKLYRYQHILK